MKSILLVITIMFSVSANAQSACYETEKNVTTKKMFTEDEWNTALMNWDTQEPTDPGIIALYGAWTVYKTALSEIKGNKKFNGDKRKHCYVGCRIAQDVDEVTATYVAWYKEKKDLTDCVEGSYFELRDHEATLLGIKLAEKSKDPQYCLDECVKIKKY